MKITKKEKKTNTVYEVNDRQALNKKGRKKRDKNNGR